MKKIIKTSRAINLAHLGECIGVTNNGTLKQMLEGNRHMTSEQLLGIRAYFEHLIEHVDELYVQSRESSKEEFSLDRYEPIAQAVTKKFKKTC